MTDQTQQVAPPAPPANAQEASARLATLTNDRAWGDKLLAGDPATTKEFNSFTAMVADGGDHVERAMAGTLPDVPDSGHRLMAEAATWLRGLGVSDDVVRQTLANHEVTQLEFNAVEAWKNQHMKSSEFSARYLAGEPDDVKLMTLANVVLSSNIKKAEAA
jgi:hypothetical protein